MIGDWLLDLLGAMVLTGVAAFTVFTMSGPVRALLVLPVILFVPGYVVLAALYPRRQVERKGSAGGIAGRIGPDGVDYVELGASERFSLSLALSLVVVGVLAFALNFVTGLYATPLMVGIAGVVGVFAVLAALRRSLVDSEARGRLPIPTRTNAPVNATFAVLMGVALVTLAASGALAAFASPADEDLTEFYLTGQNPEGEWTTQAADDAVANGETVRVGITNDEGHQQEYTVVVVSQTVEGGEVTGREELAREQVTVANGETGTVEYSGGGGGNRVVFYLYDGDAPSNADRDSAYLTTQVWLG